jgi:glutathione synthase/RimK-type ligase-like ATP-grasp enzyme
MILIISHLADPHATSVMEHLARAGGEAILFDTARFPREVRLDISHTNVPRSQMSLHLEGVRHDLARVQCVWWRRPRPFELLTEITNTEDRNFAYGECHAAIAGLRSCLAVPWINNPERDEVAARKAYQLKVAAALGLRIPETLITNDPESARNFIEQQGAAGTIYKAFSATEQSWRETRLLKPEERVHLDAVRFAPVIFQEHIRADIDLRITIIGERVFPAEIHSGATDYHVDFRMTMHEAIIQPHTLPESVVAKLHSFMHELGIVYGAIDMRLTPEGEYVFLEVNPAGQWLFIEERTGQEISKAVAEHLLNTARTHQLSPTGVPVRLHSPQNLPPLLPSSPPRLEHAGC